jgi:hypothetical protein
MSNNGAESQDFDSHIHPAGVTIRPAQSDEPALRRLAQLDSSQVPSPPVLVAEVEGQPVAAISLATGDAIADPFSRTLELRALLELRAAQLRRREARRPRLTLPRPASRAALAGSPPGAPGWLIALRTRPY